MPLARKYQIPPECSGFYHCISRCVRRAFLCGFDRYTGVSYEHRRQWIVDRLAQLTAAFAIDVYAYAIMSNHCHCVLWVDYERTLEWNKQEIIARWRAIYNGAPTMPSDDLVEVWRKRLADISWFMRALNEPIARRANREDGCKGHFWEKRFRSIALLDEAAVVACMAYVDLNPIRAGTAADPKDSDFTSIQARLRSIQQPTDTTKACCSSDSKPSITPIFGIGKQRTEISEPQYIDLVYWTAGKTSLNPTTNIERLLETLGVNHRAWVPTVNRFRSTFGLFAGNLIAVDEFIQRTNRKRRPKIPSFYEVRRE